MQVDLYFYREPEEAKQQEEEEAVAAPDYSLPANDYGMGALATDQWPAQIGDQWSTDVVQPPISGVPAVNWGDQGKKCFILVHITSNLNLDVCFLCLIYFKISNAAAVNPDVWDAAAPPQIPGADIDVTAPSPSPAPAPAPTGWD